MIRLLVRITVHGAAGEVTGSAYHVATNQASVLVDFGLFVGVRTSEKLNRVPPQLKVNKLNAVVLTHAHLDHCGRLPLLIRKGYSGPIFCTAATRDVAALILRDSAKVQAQDNERTNRKRQRAGKPPVAPLYGLADVEATIDLFRPAPYEQPVPVAPGVHARFVEAGHILGSTSIELVLEEHGHKRTVVFSGDLGPKDAPILKDAVPFTHADMVFMESTYGDRDHKPIAETITEYEGVIRAAASRKGKILVPTFAVGRAQLLQYLLAMMFRKQLFPKFPIFLDSPMAIEASNIYNHHPELYDAELRAFLSERPMEEDLSSLKPTQTADESKAINKVPGPCLILAGAGMCNAGRIVHHLKENLWRPETSVLIVGYQGEGSLGRRLVEGRKEVSIFGEKIAVKASIHTLGGFSAHAGQSDLLRWFQHLEGSRPRVVLTHGEERGRQPLAQLIHDRYLLKPLLPQLGEVIELG